MTPSRLISLLVLISVVGCSLGPSTLADRDKCWPRSDPRSASLWRGVLRIDVSGPWLDTADGAAVALIPRDVTTRLLDDGPGELLEDGEVVARSGDEVTLFGGAAGDGTLVVCELDMVHAQVSG